MKPQIKRTALIAALLILYCFAFQGMRGLYEPDEGRYSAVALQMLQTNDWMTPKTHPEQEHWTKPLLAYWGIAASISIFGKTEFAVRFSNAASFLGIILASYFLGTVFTPRRPWLVALISGTFLFPATMCNGATTDFPMTMWSAWGVYSFSYLFWSGKVERQKMHAWLLWIFFSLAFLTKGPPAVLPLLCIAIFSFMDGPKRRHVPMHWARGMGILLILGGSWYWVSIFHNPELIKYFLWDELILRVFSGHHQRHTSWYSFLYIYIPVLVFGSLPWTVFSGKGIKHSFQLAKDEMILNNANHSYQNTFLMIWLLLPLGIFIISQSNLPLYVLPLFVPLAVITAKELERSDLSLKKYQKHIIAWCLLIVLIRPIMSMVPRGKDTSRLSLQITAMHPQNVAEIVFVNTPPALGLTFYKESNVKYIPMQFNDIQHELNQRNGRLWFVEQGDLEKFQGNIKPNKGALEKIGSVKGWNNYVVFSENSASI